LLQDLVALSEDADPVTWLETERSEVCAEYVIDAMQRKLRDFDSPSPSAGPAASRPDAVSAEHPPVTADSTAITGPDFGAVQTRAPGSDVEFLVSQYLHLEAKHAEDLSTWLRREHARLIAVLKMYALLVAELRRIEPPSPGARRIQSREAIYLAPATFTIGDLVLGDTSFLLTVNVKGVCANLSRPRGIDHLLPTWWGFDAVTDNLGNQYIPQICTENTGSWLTDNESWGFESSVDIVVAPAVVTEARQLVFSTADDRLMVLGTGGPGPVSTHAWLVPLPLGDLVCNVDLE